MFATTDRTKTVLIWLGAAFVCAGFAMIPALTRSAGDSQAPSTAAMVNTASRSASDPAAIRPQNDPFARPLPGLNRTGPSRSRTIHKQSEIRVDAIVVGKVSRALITREDGDAEIVGVGDTFDSTRITSITADAVVLEDGRRIALAEKRQK